MLKHLHADQIIKLPDPTITPSKKGLTSLLQERYSCRDFLKKPLNIEQISRLLWATGGMHKDAVSSASRTIPSAGGAYPMEIFLLIGKAPNKDIKPGVYHYSVLDNSLKVTSLGDKRKELTKACWGQKFINDAPISIIIAVLYSRTTDRYGQRGIRYVHMDIGHSCQNIYLMAANLGLATVEVGAFTDQEVSKALNIKSGLVPVAVMPIGYPK